MMSKKMPNLNVVFFASDFFFEFGCEKRAHRVGYAGPWGAPGGPFSDEIFPEQSLGNGVQSLSKI